MLRQIFALLIMVSSCLMVQAQGYDEIKTFGDHNKDWGNGPERKALRIHR